MKKMIRILILCIAAFALTACSAGGTEAEEKEPLKVDLDLSLLSGTMVYAEVYNLMCDPEPYLGKVIRMAGLYNYYNDEEHGVVYHACIIQDATACCAQGIEFVRAGDFAWPEEYPEIGDPITVTGRLEIYEDATGKYLHLVDAEMIRPGD